MIIILPQRCLYAFEGESLFKDIRNALNKEQKVQLDFKDVIDLSSIFLNNAVGQFYYYFDYKFLSENMLPPINTKPEDLRMLKVVVDNAKVRRVETERQKNE